MLDNWVSLVSVVISVLGLLFVIRQLRDSTKQQESASLVEVYDINRELLTLGFSYPELFKILDDAENADPILERRYLQMWLNQLALIHAYVNHSTLRGELKEALLRDLADFLTHKNMQKHWQRYGKFYPDSFQEAVNGIIKKEPPAVAARKKVRKRWRKR